MAADWAALERHLRAQGDDVTLSWQQLERIVGGMPASSVRHPAFWSGDRPHTRAWRAAGFEVASKEPGVAVTFRRRGVAVGALGAARVDHSAAAPSVDAAGPASVLLVSCGKSKLSRPAAAKDLYTSSRFRKARQFAAQSRRPWYILSAEHGLVRPDDWLAPYERFLSDTPPAFRAAWGEWVVARLELLEGDLSGLSIEIHAGQDYVAPLEEPMAQRGARLVRPLQGLTMGQWLQWYDERATGGSAPARSATYDGPIDSWVRTLGNVACSVAPGELPGLERNTLDGPGLYAWFADEEGARDLSSGLGHAVPPGLIYVGQTGATRWPSGTSSGSTLIKRIRSQHLGGNRGSSTLRRTLGAILDAARGEAVDREELTAWMFTHLRVVPAVVSDTDVIADLERRVVMELDPPLNLDHTGASPARMRLRQLRTTSAPGP